MKSVFRRLTVGLGLTLSLMSVLPAANAQLGKEYTHQDYNSIAARQLRRQIINDAIRRQATGKGSRRGHSRATTSSHRRSHTTSKKSHRS